jgi:putative transposase
MGSAYRVKDQENMYFITCTVHPWVDVFTRSGYIDILLDSLWFCQQNKGLEIYAWVVMTNHIHLVVRSKTGKLSNTIRDFKKFSG